MQRLTTACVSLGLLILPSIVYAQASITGVVRDTSAAVLPGVIVEVSSAALIEKVRSVTPMSQASTASRTSGPVSIP